TSQGGRAMNPQRFAVIAASCGMLVLIGWVGAGVAGLDSSGIENGGAASDALPATALASDAVDVPAVSLSHAGLVYAGLPDPHQMLREAPAAPASTPDPVPNDVEASALRVEVPKMASAGTALPVPLQVLPAAASASMPDPVRNDAESSAPPIEVAALPDPREPVRLVSLFRSDPSEEDLKPALRVVETPNECFVMEICIDDYLWSFYEVTPKVDMNRVTERIKATVKKKGKTRTVIKTITKYVLGDFTWKDPIAAQRAGMSVKDYVIGGMDRDFKLKLYH